MVRETERHDVDKAFVMQRKLCLEQLDSKKRMELIAIIDKIAGVEEVSITEERILNIRYDAARVHIKRIEAVIEQCGCRVRQDWWNRCKLIFYRFTDSNAKANAVYHPGCCNKPPRK